jgi:peptidyl-prolyl cis-trans isomerase SurA
MIGIRSLTLRHLLVAVVLSAFWTVGYDAARDAAAQTATQIAAVVNDNVVTTQDLGERIELATIATGLPDDPETKRRIAPQALRGLIDEALQLQEAERLRIDVAQREIDQAFATVAERNGMTADQLAGFLESRGVPAEALRRQLRAQVAWIKIVNSRVRPRVVVTNDQVDLAMKQGPTGEEEVHLGEILLPVYRPEQEAEVLRDAAELRETLRTGASFEELARQFSVAQSAQAGGDLGWIPESGLVPELQAIVTGLQPGEIADPIRTPAGVHLIQLKDRRIASTAAPAASDRQAARQRLEEEQLQRLANRYLRDLRRSAFVDIRL